LVQDYTRIFRQNVGFSLLHTLILLSLAVSYSHQFDYSIPDRPEPRDMDFYPSELPGALTTFNLDHGMCKLHAILQTPVE
jgi:hypothetical protein